jgi:two-component system sensor histidine kinase BaeS
MHNVFLLDTEFHFLSGMKKPFRKDSLKAIWVDGEIVGWLGLHQLERLDHGPADTFMQHHIKQLYVLTGIVICLTGLIAFLLSRHLLKPINRLILGTQELAERNFSVRLQITTRDELGILANHFNSMARTLDHFEKMRRQWLTDISHELRTPITVLCGEIEALYDGIREPTQQNLASLKSEILQLAKLIDDLHMLSVADSDSINLDQKMIFPWKVLASALTSFESRFQQRRISVTTMFAQDTSETRIFGDESRLNQVFANILENICNYVTSPGTLRITGSCKAGYYELRFQDSGPGVPDEALDRLFDRLYRVDASRSRNLGGSGLGLSICQRIIELHSGSMWAEKSPMGGLSIGIKLPLA